MHDAARLAPVIVVLAACGGTGAASSASSNASAFGTASSSPAPTAPSARAPLFPVGAGDRWTYSDQSEGLAPHSTQTRAIGQVTRNADGSVAAPAIVSFAPGTAPPRAVTYVVEPDGSVDELTAHTPSFLLFPAAAVIASGHAVKVGRGAVSFDELIDSYPATVSAHGGGAATATMPAGTFSASLFVVDETVQLPGNGGGTVPAGQTHTTTTYWLVDGVGIVKIQMTSPQCASCTETLELLHYHVGT